MPWDLCPAPSGGYIIAGSTVVVKQNTSQQEGFLIKVKPEGCFDWGKIILGSNTSIRLVKQDLGDYYIVVDLNDKQIIAKLDTFGSIIWAKSLEDDQKRKLTADAILPISGAGLVVVCGNPQLSRPVLFRLDSNGNIIWQKEYSYNWLSGYLGYWGFSNFFFKDNYLYLGGNEVYNPDPLITKIRITDGVSVWTKKYSSVSSLIFGEMVDADSMVMVNAHSSLSNSDLSTIGSYVLIDTSGNVKSSVNISEQYVNNDQLGAYSGRSRLVKTAKSFYFFSNGSSMSKIRTGQYFFSKLIKLDTSLKINWIKSSAPKADEHYYWFAPTPKQGVALLGMETSNDLIPNNPTPKLLFKIIDSSGGNTNTSCSFYNQSYIETPLAVTQQPAERFSYFTSNYTVTDHNLQLSPFFPDLKFKCSGYIDSCSYLKLNGPSSICNLNASYTYYSSRNKACNQLPLWQLPSNAKLISKTPDSVTLQFLNFGRYVLYVTNPLSCAPSFDSLVVLAEPGAIRLNLGGNTKICPQQSMILHAGTKFISYDWNTGSKDSILKIYQPGTYSVKVIDSCGNVLFDSIVVSLAPAPPNGFLPSDTTICSHYEFEIKSSRSFNEYLWSNGASSASITINQPGKYWLKVTDENNCVGQDTIQIQFKDCLYGIYMPNAFTPNNDGKNDVFRPVIYGQIEQYRLTIFNRWGQIVFISTDPSKGWDGSVRGLKQGTNVFTWACVYKLKGTNIKTSKGIITCIR